jgi:glycosidase
VVQGQGRSHHRSKRAAAATAVALLAATSLLLGAACDAGPPRRDCSARIWVPVSAGDVTVAGSFSAWAPIFRPFDYDENWRLLRLQLPPGEHGYQLVRPSGERFVDPLNPLSTFRDDGDGDEVSLLLVPDCAEPKILVDRVVVEPSGEFSLDARFLAAGSGAELDPDTVRGITATGAGAGVGEVDPDVGQLSLGGSLPRGKTTLYVDASDTDGVAARTERVVAWHERAMPAWRDGLLYQIMIDRFRGDGGASLDAPATPGSRAGGTLDGVTSALEDGSLEELGVTGLWLSPVYLVPDEAREGRDGRMYEGYHGYWVVESRRVDPRIGGEEALERLVAAAHARGISVVLDIVPNHVYETNPLLDEHPTWFRPDACVCGDADCDWGTEALSCLFVPYLPDVKLEHPEALRNAVEEARFWTERFDLDGVRLDAVPMIPRAALRRISEELRRAVSPREAMFVLGEVFTGPGRGGVEQIAAFLGPSALDSAFDFPLMWALHGAVARGTGSFAEVEDVLSYSEQRYRGSGVLLARMLDNHDVPRFMAVATGEGAVNPWTDPPEQPTVDEPYDRMELGFAAIFSLPGLPLVYYGDEIGLSGANDPDNRRVMPSESELLPRQRSLRERVRELSRLRRCSSALRSDAREALVVEPRHYAYARGLAGEARALVALSSERQASELLVPTVDTSTSVWVDALTGERFDQGTEGLRLALPAFGYRILLPEGDACLP